MSVGHVCEADALQGSAALVHKVLEGLVSIV